MQKEALILYATMHGQAEAVAKRIAAESDDWDVVATVKDVRSASAGDLAGRDWVILVASVHFGKHQRSIARFVKRNRTWLAEKHTAFISVSGDAAEASTKPRAEQYAKDFFRITGWTPAASLVVGGAVKFTKYNWFVRYVTKRSLAAKGVQLDPSRDYEYTDWTEVMRFAKAFFAGESVKVA